jgi:hypothetical protein
LRGGYIFFLPSPVFTAVSFVAAVIYVDKVFAKYTLPKVLTAIAKGIITHSRLAE